MTIGRTVRRRLLRRWVELRSLVTLRRREKRVSTYALRLLSLFMVLVALPVWKLAQLGPLDALLALVKVAAGVALAVGALAAVFAAEEWARRRRRTA